MEILATVCSAAGHKKNYKSRAAGAPDWDTFHIQKFSAKNAFAMHEPYKWDPSRGLLQELQKV
jgi:hypothetical protein